MKKVAFYLGCTLALLSACQSNLKELDSEVASNDPEANVSFTLNLPSETELASRALYGAQSNSAAGGITNVDMNAYDLRYLLVIYRVEAGGTTVAAVSPITRVVDAYQPVSVSLRLTPNRNYKAVVWADFVTQGTETDLHYNTSAFPEITYNSPTSTAVLNDESRDAYFLSKDFSLAATNISENLVLKRPFAKIRVVATDWGLHNLEKVDNIKVTYYDCKRFTGMNAMTGVATSENLPNPGITTYTGTIDKDNKEYALSYDLTPNNRTLMVDYLMTDLTEQTPIHLEFEALDGTTSVAKHNLNTNIPIQRNWLTTIIGDVLTTNATLTVSISEHFTNDWVVAERWWDPLVIVPKEPNYDAATQTYTIRTREEFAWLPDNTAAIQNKNVILESDIDMSGVRWKPINQAFNFDGKNHTLRNFTINAEDGSNYKYEWRGWTIYETQAYLGVFGSYNGQMKNVTFENITINGRADDAVHIDPATSTAVSHSDEPAYFAGCIGYTGANWSTTAMFTNVHAKHVVIKASTNNGIVQNLGGLVGWVGTGGGNTKFENCSAEDVYLTSKSGLFDGEIGGFIGEILGGRGVVLKNCSSDKVTIRIPGSSKPSTTHSFVGKVKNGAGTVFDNCTPATTVQYVNHTTGAPLNVTSANPLYGSVENGESSIQITP